MTSIYSKKIVSILSRPRLRKYLEEANKFSPKSNDEKIEIALQFYAWNTALSAAFYGPLQALEITLRNVINERLTNAYGKIWYDSTQFVDLSDDSTAKLNRAKEKSKRKKNRKTYATDDIVSDLSFGFWINLFIYRSLWHKELHKIFFSERLTKKELKKERVKLYKRLDNLRYLRNRIAHHEPIFHRNLQQDMANILDMLGWICPDERKRVERYIRLPDVIKMRPPDDSELKF